MQDEMLDLVDEHDQVIGTMWRSQVYKQKRYSQIRAVWLMIKNSQGQLWILRRSYSRSILPGGLDGAVVGHVKSGETYEQALFREALEEIGVDMNNFSYRLLAKLSPKEDNAFCFTQVYEAELEQSPENWNREEFSECFWAMPSEILERIKNGDKYKSLLPLILQKFYNY